MTARPERIFIARGKTIPLGRSTVIMGIINSTPDSFSDGGELSTVKAGLNRAVQHFRDGARIIDIGGESTRPGSDPVPLDEEINRTVPLIRAVVTAFENEDDMPFISIDSCKSEVARLALQAGAHIINDISGGNFDEAMADTAAQFGAGVVLMHIKGTPSTMQKNPHYDDLIGEVHEYLSCAADRFIKAGVARESILVDPGIGFGKTVEHNLELIARLSEFRGIGAGILIGPSRKSFIGKITGRSVKQRVEGTIGAAVAGVISGADVVRVHDVAQVADAVRVADRIRSSVRK